MDQMDHALIAEMAAAIARIAGMKAENAYCALRKVPPAYREERFFSEATGLEHIAAALRQRAETSTGGRS